MFGSMIAHRGTSIGPGTVVGTHSIVGYAKIGENVLHGGPSFAHLRQVPARHAAGSCRRQEVVETYQTINIGDNSWIGQNAIVMANIGENCTISAGSVVYKDVPPNSTFMGNPARKVNLESPSAREGAIEMQKIVDYYSHRIDRA